MVDSKRLEDKIKCSGKKITFLAEKVGCSRQYFRAKCDNTADFKLSEVEILCKELGINNADRSRIFFAK